MKPSWDDAPSWAQWLAMDPNGRWFWFSDEPVWGEFEEEWTPNRGRYEGAHFSESAESSKERRP